MIAVSLTVVTLLGGMVFGVVGPAAAATKLKVVGITTEVCLRGVAAPGGVDYGCLHAGQAVAVKCWVMGVRVRGTRHGRAVSTRHWARTTTGRYISELYLNGKRHPHRKCKVPAPTTVPTTPTSDRISAPATWPVTPTIGPSACPAKPAAFNELHLQSAAIAVGRCAAKKWPQITWIGGWRPSDPYPDHPSGQAVDIMLPGGCSRDPAKAALADAIADYFMRHANAYGVVYVISQQRTWHNWRDPIIAPATWRTMSDRGGCTANHRDHVHVSTVGPVHVG